MNRPTDSHLRRLGSAVWLCLVITAGCRPAVAPPAPPVPATAVFSFEERAVAAGVNFTYRNGEDADVNSIMESIGGGVAIIDYDRDDRPDLFFPGGGHFPARGEIAADPHGFFRQRAPWQFAAVAGLAGVETSTHYSFGAASADADNDGFPDLFVTGYRGVTFWKNQGDGTFREATEVAGLQDRRFSTSAAWGDLNNDGALDLYVAHYVDWSWENHPACLGANQVPDVCPPRQFSGLDDRLYLSNQDGTYRDASSDWGLVKQGKGLGVAIGDLDGDGDVDVYVGNDTTENFLYINQGDRLVERGFELGVALDDRAVANGSMGVDFGDSNGDGRPDIWVANYEQETFALYRNDGPLGYQFVSRQTGVGELGELFVGFGTKFGDFDSDGDEDLIVSNGHVIQTARLSPIRQLPLLLENREGRFVRSPFPDTSYCGQPHRGRGLATGDLDGDGDLDVVIVHNNEPVALLENRTPRQLPGMQVHLIGRRANRDALGATVIRESKLSGQSQLVKGGTSYLSSSAFDLHFSSSDQGSLRIRWPSGVESNIAFPGAGAGRIHATEP